MKIIIVIALIFIIYKVIDSKKSSVSYNRNSSSTIMPTPPEQAKIIKSFYDCNNHSPITDCQSYYKMLRECYEKYGNAMLNLGVIMCLVRTYHLDDKLNKNVSDIQKDLNTIANGEALPGEKLPLYKTKRWKEMKREENGFSDIFSDMFPVIHDAESYLNTLKDYYLEFDDDMFDKDVIDEFIRMYELDTNYNISYNDVIKDLLKIKKSADITQDKTAAPSVQEQSKQSQTVNTTPPKETEQSQATSHTPPVHTQSKQSQTVSTTPPQSILDTQTIFDYVKAMPVKWGHANPNVTPNKELQQLCNSFLTSWEIPKCYSPDSIQGMEYIIQKKRARTPDKADYNKVMETNMLFELYKYSYSMNIIKVLVDRKNDTVKINMSELMGLIQEDCRRHLSNLEYEKKTNPTIQDMLQKYNHDTQKVKMIINDYVEGREYDYIFSSLMTSTLMNIVNYILNTEMETAKGYQPTLQVVRQYPSSDLTAALDAYISSFIGMALNSYTNGGSIPRKPQ